MAAKSTIGEFKTLAEKLYGTTVLNHAQIKSLAQANNLRIPGDLWTRCKTGPNRWDLAQDIGPKGTPFIATPAAPGAPVPNLSKLVADGAKAPAPVDATVNYIPEVTNTFVPWGNYELIEKVIKAKIFYPMYITGHTGNGKTSQIVQAAARNNRELIRVNFTIETDELDLLGGFQLVEGDTVWVDGPVVTAMKRGALLLLDEIDLGSNKIMCLQPILEGNGIFLKKINQYVHPEAGFNIIATANTKGTGSDTGKFVGTNVLNEAFLDRFSAMFFQPYAPTKVEGQILRRMADKLDLQGPEMKALINSAIQWADITRRTHETGGCDDLISTRRLLDFIKTYAIFGSSTMAIETVTERFDEDTKKSFRDLWKSIVPGEFSFGQSGVIEEADPTVVNSTPTEPTPAPKSDECPF